MHQLLAASAALAVALAAAAPPSPSPFPLGTLQPFASPAPAGGLPNIERVRSLPPACVTMRDVVAPAFLAARRADARFVETRKHLPEYAEIADDLQHRTDIYRESALAKIDADATALLGDTVAISRALGDPRLAATVGDPQVQSERAELQRVYDAQKTRADLLEQFVIRQRVAIAKNGIDDDSALAGPGQPIAPPGAPYMPDPAQTPPPDMPLLNGTGISDKRAIGEWATGIASGIYRSENRAAKTFLEIASRCRGM
jgi:hypothetical protein